MLISKDHKKPAFRTRVANRISDIPAGDWNKVFPDALEGYDLFRTLDDSGLEQFSFYYIMVYDRKTPVGATACFFMNYSLDTTIKGPLRRLTSFIKRLAPNIFRLRAFICGMPFALGRMGMAGEDDLLMRVMLRRMERIAKKKKAHVIAFKDFSRDYARLLDPLMREGFSRFSSLPLAELAVRFKDFEEYLNTLSAESRYGLRRKFRKVDNKINIELEVLDALDGAVLQDVYRLYLNVETKHGGTFEVMPIDFFGKIFRNMPGRAKCFLWRIDGKPAMFLLSLLSKDVFSDFYVGFDYAYAYKHHLYFVQFRDAMKWCIEHGIKRYEMGITGYEAKRRLGFGFAPQYIYVKLRNKTLRPVFNTLCQLLKFENFDPALKNTVENAGDA